MRRTPATLLPGVTAFVLGAAVSLLSGCGREGGPGAGRGLEAFPPPPPVAASTRSTSDFVGSEACADCHAEQYRAWASSTHGRAGGDPGPEVVIAPFDASPISFADGVVIPRVREGRYEFLVRQDGFADTVYVASGVIGRGHMIGGGTQGFLTLMPDGTERFLPWDWSRHASVWFCNTGTRLNQGWVPITREMRLADCGDWPPLRPIGTVERFANCQECHGSQIRTTFDAEARRYVTERTSLGINCESCHGPGRDHVTWARTGARPTSDPGLGTLAYLDKDASLEVCFRCHALKDVVREGYLPDDPLEQYYALKFPVLGDQPYFADGRVRSFAYQANHLASACYLDGPMDCVSCHEPHGQRYWDTDHRPLANPFDDGQCTSCHPSKLMDPQAHTHHPYGSGPADRNGVRCVSCHMPYLQHPEVGPQIPFARSDHTIAIPRPVFDADLGIVGGCAGCHEDRSALELQGQARAWWGELRPHRPAVQGQVDELKARNAAEAGAMLLHPEVYDPLVQFQALSRLVVGYLRPDDPTTDPGIVANLRALATWPDLDVRALSLAALHWTRGDDGDVRRLLVRALEGDGDGALRARWALALGFLGDHFRDRGDTDRARAAYRKALELEPDDPRIFRARAQLHSAAGDAVSAETDLRRSLELDGLVPLTWVNLGIVLEAKGDLVGARDAYARAAELDPHEALAYFNMGNTYRQAGSLEQALDAYLLAVQADPGLGVAHFEVARTYLLLDRPAEALPFARRAVEFRRDHAPSLAMLRDLEQALGGAAP